MSIPYVLLYGATGRSGRDSIKGLQRVGGLRIGATTRSKTSPGAEELKKLGVELLELDVTKDSEESLIQKLHGVDVIVSVVTATMDALESQKPLFKAAKAAGVKRVVPSDFGTPAPEGVMLLNDMKLSIHQYIKDLGIGYTWIDIGWWKQITLPYPPSFDAGWSSALSYRFFAHGKQPFAVTDRRFIGDFVGRIIKDERTLNQYVFCYEDVVTQEQAWKIAEEVCSEGAAIPAKKVQVSPSELQEQLKGALIAVKDDPSDLQKLAWQFILQYNISMYIRGDDTPARAKELGALDARELYPDLQVRSLRDFAPEFYADPGNMGF